MSRSKSATSSVVVSSPLNYSPVDQAALGGTVSVPVTPAAVKASRAPTFGAAQVVTVVSPVNPKKPGSQAHARFALYVSGQSVAVNLKAGVRRDDLAWDSKRGFIIIS